MRVRFKESYLKEDKVTFTPRNVANLFFGCELDAWSQVNFTIKDCLFRAAKLTKNADLNKYVCSEYGIGFMVFNMTYWYGIEYFISKLWLG